MRLKHSDLGEEEEEETAERGADRGQACGGHCEDFSFCLKWYEKLLDGLKHRYGMIQLMFELDYSNSYVYNRLKEEKEGNKELI